MRQLVILTISGLDRHYPSTALTVVCMKNPSDEYHRNRLRLNAFLFVKATQETTDLVIVATH